MSLPVPLRLGFLFSGGGRTLENLVEKAREGSIHAEVVVAVSSHGGAGGIERARRLGIPCEVLDYRERGNSFSDDITAVLDARGVDLVTLGGFLRHYRFPPRYAGRILNIHPSLLPRFGGKGFYGDRVHAAVLAAGEKFSGCTVHQVTEEYDEGPIILQRVVPVRPGDTVHDLAERVFAEECIAYPEAIRLHAAGLLAVEKGIVTLGPGR
ncbi:MAG TPA: phosphoribosylglycinamide formyltransferase [Planctomycetota bacterium]|nr:phosphoribosylglycinamide formyltransferase [Planctomycetota bacterium]